ncbi:OLC1v1025243C1 [Oldenlandia corymbosa var. corymbosa]|uniref:OLC1v1025243C1 n=1 Tax=Oldenlandia corymbosa var. corymbosa TaxID=529605 RepID=A0AAV1C4L5_OLDCO|nr:OLC1v1025243C1 [Oldenlandia corymbosa var. corymbosa]
MRSLLLSAKCSRQDVLVQFWAPVTTPGGKKMLTVSQQPFGFGELCNGLCRYRCFCIDQQGFVGEDISQIGPPARVFQQGSPEFCPNIELYTPQEFPMGRYARSCGIVSYRALPLFQIRNHDGSQQQHNCVGVLEILSLGTLVNLELESLQDLGLSRPDSHSDECIRNRQSNLDLKNVWEFMMTEHNLPLIQVWVPCMCDSPGDNNNTSSSRNRILCQFTYSNWCNMKYSRMFDQLTCEAETCFVTNGKSWVGKACSLNKICSFKDTNLFSISDYPLVHLIRSSDVRACLAIPLKLLHPQLPPFIIEVFLPPPDQNWDGNLVALLTLLLSTVARGLIVLEWTPVEGSCVKFAGADGDNYFYFDIIQDGDRALENGREGLQFQQSETFGAVKRLGEFSPMVRLESIGMLTHNFQKLQRILVEAIKSQALKHHN